MIRDFSPFWFAAILAFSDRSQCSMHETYDGIAFVIDTDFRMGMRLKGLPPIEPPKWWCWLVRFQTGVMRSRVLSPRIQAFIRAEGDTQGLLLRNFITLDCDHFDACVPNGINARKKYSNYKMYVRRL
jgi:hypothetical protein